MDSPLAHRYLVFLGGVPCRKAALRDVRDGCDRCSPGFWLLTHRLLLTCSLWLDISRYLWEDASNTTTGSLLRDLALRAIVAFCNPHTTKEYGRGTCADLVGEHLAGY